MNPYAAQPPPYGGAPGGAGAPPGAFGAPPAGFGGAGGPYGAPPPAFGTGPAGFGPVAPVTRMPGTGAGCAIAAVVGVLMLVGGLVGFFALRAGSQATGPSATASAGGYPIAQLATLSLKQSPDQMQKVTGVQPTKEPMGTWDMEVKLSGGTWNRLDLTWDEKDSSHVKMAYLYADAPSSNDAAIRQKLAALFGKRLDKNTSFNWHGAFFSYSGDSAHGEGEPESGSEGNPHWKEQSDAMWDVMRSAVLGQNVTISDAETRDWLGRGYTLTAVGAVDPGVDVDHASAMLTAAFPAVAMSTHGMLSGEIAVDHPWFGQAQLEWTDEKGGTCEGVYLNPLPGADNHFPNQPDIAACVQALVGGKPHHYEGDHLKGDYSDEWEIPGGGNIRVYGHLVHVTTGGHFTKKTPKAEWQKLFDGLDACGRHR